MKRAAAILALAALAACHKGPSPSLALLPKSGFYAVASADRGAWRIDLHLGGAGETRSFEGKSEEGFPVAVVRKKEGPVATWTAAPERFFSGRPFEVKLKTEGGSIPLRIEVPAVQPGQNLVGLNVVVVK